MVWIYLIVQALGLGIIAWSFKVEDKDDYATPFEIGSLLSLCWVMAAAPLPVKLLTGFLMVRFHSRISHAFEGGWEAILSYFRTSFQALTELRSTDFDPAPWSRPGPLSRFLTNHRFCQWPEQQTANDTYANSAIIDIDAVEVTVRLR